MTGSNDVERMEEHIFQSFWAKLGFDNFSRAKQAVMVFQHSETPNSMFCIDYILSFLHDSQSNSFWFCFFLLFVL